MKYRTLILLILFTVLTVLASATTLDETDYPAQYQVITTSKVGSLMIGNFCTMGLRDLANATMGFVVQRRGHGSCHVWDSGITLHGRREKDKIKLLTKDEKGKLKVEDWPIISTFVINPASK